MESAALLKRSVQRAQDGGFTSGALQTLLDGDELNPEARCPASPECPPTSGCGSGEREWRHRTSWGPAGSSLQEEGGALQEETPDNHWFNVWKFKDVWSQYPLTFCSRHHNSNNMMMRTVIWTRGSDSLNLDGSTKFVGSRRFGGRALSPENDEANCRQDNFRLVEKISVNVRLLQDLLHQFLLVMIEILYSVIVTSIFYFSHLI